MLNAALARIENLIGFILPQKTAIAGCSGCRPVVCVRTCCEWHCFWSSDVWICQWLCADYSCSPCAL